MKRKPRAYRVITNCEEKVKKTPKEADKNYTSNVYVLNNVKNVVLIDLSFLLCVQNMINCTFQAFIAHALCA